MRTETKEAVAVVDLFRLGYRTEPGILGGLFTILQPTGRRYTLTILPGYDRDRWRSSCTCPASGMCKHRRYGAELIEAQIHAHEVARFTDSDPQRRETFNNAGWDLRCWFEDALTPGEFPWYVSDLPQGYPGEVEERRAA